MPELSVTVVRVSSSSVNESGRNFWLYCEGGDAPPPDAIVNGLYVRRDSLPDPAPEQITVVLKF